jgi:hypothetical protein
MGLVLKNGQWVLQAGGTAGFDPTAGAIGAELLRNTTSSVLTGSLLQPSASVNQLNIFSARGMGGITGTASSRISATRNLTSSLDLTNFSDGFTWAGWIKPDGSATNNTSTIFFSSEPDGNDAIIFRRNGTSSNLIFEYYQDATLKGKATTDTAPWSNNQWKHYALTFSDNETLTIFTNGNPQQIDVNTDTGGSTPSNILSHSFNTGIPNASRLDFRMFGGDLKTDSNDGLTGEFFNIGFWEEALTPIEIETIYSSSHIDFSINAGSYTSAQSLVFSCSFSQTAADGTNIALTRRGLVNQDLVSGSSKPL